MASFGTGARVVAYRIQIVHSIYVVFRGKRLQVKVSRREGDISEQFGSRGLGEPFQMKH